MIILGLSAKLQSGKDTVGDYLVKKYSFEKIAFANSLKKAAMEVFSFTHEQVYDGKLKEVIDPRWGFTPRYALQKMGTECMRDNFDKAIWVKSLYAKILTNINKNYCITDLRFPEEMSAIKSWGGKVIKIIRNNNITETEITKHASETALDYFTDWDYVVYNDGTFEQLYEKVDGIMRNIL